MTFDEAEDINDDNLDNELDADIEIDAAEKKDANIRKRIDDLLEKKRLKELLDDTDDW